MNNITITEPSNPDDQVSQLVYRALQKGRRYFGSSGASLTHQVHNPPEGSPINQKSAKIGLEGERDTTKFLREWCADKPNVVLVDSVSIQFPKDGSPDPRLEVMSPEEIQEENEKEGAVNEEEGVIDNKDTDHILIIGEEVILIDTKKWKKGLYTLSPKGEVMRNRKPTPFPGGKVRMRGAVELWRKYLGYTDKNDPRWRKLSGIVFVNNEDAKVVRSRNWWILGAWRVVERERMLQFLDNKYFDDKALSPVDRSHINTDLVAKIVRCAVPPYDERKRVLDSAALRDFGI